jgi:hypothetical protein
MFQTDLFTAVWTSQLSLVTLFLESQPNLILSLDQSEYGNEWSILHYAVYQKDLPMIRYLLTCPLVNVNIQNKDKFTPLFYAAQQNQKEICEMLLEAGADPSIAGQDLEAYPDTPPLCPVDHIVDSPELIDIFRAHEKCVKPFQQPHLSTAHLSLDGLLSWELINAEKISHLPIQQWNLTFFLRNQDSILLTVAMKQFRLKTEQKMRAEGMVSLTTVSCQPQVSDLELLMKAIANVPSKERNGTLEMQILAVNAMGEGDDSSERCPVDLSEIVG